jgi:GGDEF domain-containing protein
VSAVRVLKVQLAKANKTLQDLNAVAPQNAYTKWLAGKDERMKQYQATHDQLVKTIGKQQADQYLATMLDTEKKTGEMMAQMSRQGSEMMPRAFGDFQAKREVERLEVLLSR